MAILNLVIFLLSLFVLVKSAGYAIKFSSKIARAFHLSEFIVSFFIVSLISVFPEGTISVISAIRGTPEFGMGTLLGSNVADLTIVFGIAVLFSANGISVKSTILRKNFFYLALLLLPVVLGVDGHFSRMDGILLVLAGVLFYITLSLESRMFRKVFDGLKRNDFWKDAFFFLLSMSVLLFSANSTVKFGIAFANDMRIPAVLVGLTIVSIGTCLPELFFSIRAVRKSHDELALGDVLGTVITDATILLGIVALITPFRFEQSIILVTGLSMFITGLLAIGFIGTGKRLTKKEGLLLILFYCIYLAVQIFVNGI